LSCAAWSETHSVISLALRNNSLLEHATHLRYREKTLDIIDVLCRGKHLGNWKRCENQFKPVFKKYQELLNPSIQKAQMKRMIIYGAFGLMRNTAENAEISTRVANTKTRSCAPQGGS
jgi:hypothetical protein